MSNKIKFGRYKHYKGNIYEVIGTATHTETEETLVLYLSIKNSEEDKLWARPLENFLEKVEVNSQSVPRFTFLD